MLLCGTIAFQLGSISFFPHSLIFSLPPPSCSARKPLNQTKPLRQERDETSHQTKRNNRAKKGTNEPTNARNAPAKGTSGREEQMKALHSKQEWGHEMNPHERRNGRTRGR